jgi:PIN domain nuclease of toxin-antitoxin system
MSSSWVREIKDRRNDVRLSIASLWEIALKVRLGRLTLPAAMLRWLRDPVARNSDGYTHQPIDERHLWLTLELPLFHRDPVDRLLVAQAIAEDLVLVSVDRDLSRYPVTVGWADRDVAALKRLYQ